MSPEARDRILHAMALEAGQRDHSKRASHLIFERPERILSASVAPFIHAAGREWFATQVTR